MKSLSILANIHPWYNYLDASICQGLQELGHEVFSYSPVYGYVAPTNYVERWALPTDHDLFIQFVKGQGPLQNCKSILCFGEDSHAGLEQEFQAGFDAVFVRDHIAGEPGIPINFGIEDRYYCATDTGIKPLKDREIDICFLGSLAGYKGNRREYVERLRKDFASYNLMLGPRQFDQDDDYWSKWTRPWCAHDPRYFEALANSKVCLSFRGAGPDCGRHYEVLASGAVCLIEDSGVENCGPRYWWWFHDYDQLCSLVDRALNNLDVYQAATSNWFHLNREHHSTAARARYLLEKVGLA